MARIRVNMAGLREDKGKIAKYRQELHDYNNRLDALILRIGDSWEGDASTAYINKMTRYKQKALEMENVLREFESYAEKAASKFEEIDSKGAARIRGC